MCSRNHCHIDIVLAVELLLRNDDLAGAGIIRVRDWVVQNANSANNFSNRPRLVKAFHVRWVADNERGASGLLTAADSNSASTLEENLVDGRVKHVCAAVDGTET